MEKMDNYNELYDLAQVSSLILNILFSQLQMIS